MTTSFMTQFIKTLVIILFVPFFLPARTLAQSTFLPQDSKFDHFLDRIQILQQTDADMNLTVDKPISRRLAVHIAHLADSLHKFYPYDDIDHLSKVDQANLSSLLMNNIEWVTGNRDTFMSKRPWLK